MKALVYHGPGQKAWEEVPDPALSDDTDAIVRVDAVTICGTDLHILKGDVPTVTEGRILGHEAVGTIDAVGTGGEELSRSATGCSCPASRACGACRFCREGRYGQCLGGGGWILGHLIDGTQAEYGPGAVRRHLDVPRCPPGGRRGGCDARRHPAHGVRGRGPQRPTCARATSSPSSAPGRSGSPPSWERASTAPPTSSRSTGGHPPRRRQALRRRRRRQQRP